MTKENAIDFLLYSYFEVTLESNEEDLLRAAINRAYRDASSHVLSVKNDKSGKKKAVVEKISTQIKGLSDTQDYDSWFERLCGDLKTIYKGEEFYIGHAQKWINMTMKYLYILKSIFEKYDKPAIFPQLTGDGGLEQKLHFPVDDLIMEALWNEDAQFLPLREGKKATGKYSKDKVVPWSQWEEQYQAFRDKLPERDKSPLDWEGPVWIEIAKDRKRKELEKLEEKHQGKEG